MGLWKCSEVMPNRQPVLPLRCRSSSKTFSATGKVSDMLGKWFTDRPHCHMERDGDDEEEKVPEGQWKRRARRDS